MFMKTRLAELHASKRKALQTLKKNPAESRKKKAEAALASARKEITNINERKRKDNND